MNKSLSIALLAVAIILIVVGVNASHSFSSDVSRFFTGAPTDKSLWFFIGGLTVGVVGVLGLVKKNHA